MPDWLGERKSGSLASLKIQFTFQSSPQNQAENRALSEIGPSILFFLSSDLLSSLLFHFFLGTYSINYLRANHHAPASASGGPRLRQCRIEITSCDFRIFQQCHFAAFISPLRVIIVDLLFCSWLPPALSIFFSYFLPLDLSLLHV